MNFPFVFVRVTTSLLVFGTALAGCGAPWHVRDRSSDHRVPKRVTLYVAMSPAVAESDSGLAAAVVDALATELHRRGYEVSTEVAQPGEKPPVPRVELQIVDSKGGNTTMRGAGQFAGVFGLPGAAVGAGTGIAGASSITVDCYVVADRGNTTFRGRLSAMSIGNTTGYDAVEAGERVGLKIASEIVE